MVAAPNRPGDRPKLGGLTMRIDGQRRAYADPAKRRWYALSRARRYSRYLASLAANPTRGA
jgi:hypothetical protein